jgi:glyoxylase-like metal-dependent hydrolase (beta-lactamase superfamily II)
VKEVGDGVFQLESTGRMVNIFLVQARVPVLVDAGMERHGPAVVEELRTAGVAPKLVVLTHADFDHTGGADAVRRATGAPVWAPAAERPLLTGELRRRFVVRAMIRAANRGRAPTSPKIDRWIEDGDEVEGLRAVATPGHTPGHTAYLHGSTLIAGDSVITGEAFREPVPMFCMDTAETRRSIEKLAGLDTDLAVCGHGPASRHSKLKLAELVANWREPEPG